MHVPSAVSWDQHVHSGNDIVDVLQFVANVPVKFRKVMLDISVLDLFVFSGCGPLSCE